ncbi:hypothetical protein U1Q18_051986 [Sarracenia purpurea var. burkii]
MFDNVVRQDTELWRKITRAVWANRHVNLISILVMENRKSVCCETEYKFAFGFVGFRGNTAPERSCGIDGVAFSTPRVKVYVRGACEYDCSCGGTIR